MAVSVCNCMSQTQPFLQCAGTFGFDMNAGNASYNALQAKLEKSLSSGLFFLASHTWSKSLDIESTAYEQVLKVFTIYTGIEDHRTSIYLKCLF